MREGRPVCAERLVDVAFGVAFGAVSASAMYGVALCGAWWHVGTALVCGVLSVALLRRPGKRGGGDGDV